MDANYQNITFDKCDIKNNQDVLYSIVMILMGKAVSNPINDKCIGNISTPKRVLAISNTIFCEREKVGDGKITIKDRRGANFSYLIKVLKNGSEKGNEICIDHDMEPRVWYKLTEITGNNNLVKYNPDKCSDRFKKSVLLIKYSIIE